MRQEEKQLLVSRLPWFALALFLVFFAYGELHELEHKVKLQEIKLESSSAPLIGLKEDLDRSKANLKVHEEAKQNYQKLLDQIPSSEDSHIIIRSLEGLGERSSVAIEEITMREQQQRKGESFSRLSLQIRLRASYEQIRTFVIALESTVDEKLAGLLYMVKKVEMTKSSSKLLATINVQVKLKTKGF